jgi:hypothetical protein
LIRATHFLYPLSFCYSDNSQQPIFVKVFTSIYISLSLFLHAASIWRRHLHFDLIIPHVTFHLNRSVTAMTTPRGFAAPVRSVNENKALRHGPQPALFPAAGPRPHSPTKPPSDLHHGKPLIVVPKPTAAGNPAKSKILPGLAPLRPITPSGSENAGQPTAAEAKPRVNLRDRMSLLADQPPVRHSLDPINPTPPDAAEMATPDFSDDPGDGQAAMPLPLLKCAKRSVRKLG